MVSFSLASDVLFYIYLTFSTLKSIKNSKILFLKRNVFQSYRDVFFTYIALGASESSENFVR